MAEYIQGIDVSSHQSTDLSAIIGVYQPEHVVVKLYLPEELPPQSHSLLQIESARQHGKTVGGYIWGYKSLDAGQSVAAAIDLCAQANLQLPILWIDCETYNDDPGPDAAWLREAKSVADSNGMHTGLYTGLWWIDGWFQGGQDAFQEFADWPLWLADYRSWASPYVVPRPMGFHSLAGWQYSGTGVDRNLFDKRYTVYQDEPQPDPCQPERDRIARVQAIADQKPYRPPSKRKLLEALA